MKGYKVYLWKRSENTEFGPKHKKFFTEKLIAWRKEIVKSNNESIVSNLRHYEQLQLTIHEVNSIINGMKNMSIYQIKIISQHD